MNQSTNPQLCTDRGSDSTDARNAPSDDARLNEGMEGEKTVHDQLIVHSAWVCDVWSPSGLPPNGIEHLMVISTGLPGESGELLEQHAFAGTCKGNPEELVLEFGDVLYYWLMIVIFFDLRISDLLLVATDASFLPPGSARLPISIGKVSEATKKFVRNDKQILSADRRLQLVQGMGMVWQDWSRLKDHHGLSLAEVLAANQRKLNARYAWHAKKAFKAVAVAASATVVVLV